MIARQRPIIFEGPGGMIVVILEGGGPAPDHDPGDEPNGGPGDVPPDPDGPWWTKGDYRETPLGRPHPEWHSCWVQGSRPIFRRMRDAHFRSVQ